MCAVARHTCDDDETESATARSVSRRSPHSRWSAWCPRTRLASAVTRHASATFVSCLIDLGHLAPASSAHDACENQRGRGGSHGLPRPFTRKEAVFTGSCGTSRGTWAVHARRTSRLYPRSTDYSEYCARDFSISFTLCHRAVTRER